eukprot:GHVL01033052.1.p1 GENE.GHVL01033052.1~~GHVL01033052.1.p1  ORF type:complete len:205 (+),score=31.18 GHVL01033052.1:24-638(+)
MSKPNPNKYKMVMLGEAGVGKTAVVNKFIYDDYRDKYEPTIGIDFFSKHVTLASGTTVRLQLWDTAGQERFKSLTSSYIRDAAVAIVVFDITNQQTFDACGKWVSNVKEKRGDEVILVLVGNKSDLADKRHVQVEDAENYAKSVSGMYKETSALTGANVASLFQELAESIAKVDPNLGSSSATSGGKTLTADSTGAKPKAGCNC